ncbi:MAG: PDZ domain-containing protein [Planctomycetota bacterium]|nr:PDZ domain-containing protein [Planctomycetota bacterium]MDA1105620.1 PDZ domain-containing protein [Planctomycetota bacterium]
MCIGRPSLSSFALVLTACVSLRAAGQAVPQVPPLPPELQGQRGAREDFQQRVRDQVAAEVGPAAVEAAGCGEAIERLLERMGSASFDEREAATVELLQGNRPTAEILACLDARRWDDEVLFRALAVVVDRIVLAPRGALGVSMQPATIGNRPGVTIHELIAGLPAEKVLRVGDRLYRIDGVAVLSNEECIAAIQSHAPGEVLRVNIARPRRGADGKALLDPAGLPVEDEFEFTVKLGSDEVLDKANRTRGMRGPSQNFADERRRAVLEAIKAWFPEGRELAQRKTAPPTERVPLGREGLSPR